VKAGADAAPEYKALDWVTPGRATDMGEYFRAAALATRRSAEDVDKWRNDFIPDSTWSAGAGKAHYIAGSEWVGDQSLKAVNRRIDAYKGKVDEVVAAFDAAAKTSPEGLTIPQRQLLTDMGYIDASDPKRLRYQVPTGVGRIEGLKSNLNLPGSHWLDVVRYADSSGFANDFARGNAWRYRDYVVRCFNTDKPYDRFVRELLTSNGSNFRVGPVNFYRATPSKTPEGIASVVALTFMGSRANQWPSNMLVAVSAFFSQISYKPSREWKEEIVYWDPDVELTQATNAAIAAAAAAAAAATNAPAPAQGATNAPGAKGASNVVAKAAAPPPPPSIPPVPKVGVFPDGTRVALPPGRDPREIFADWLIHPDNPWFTKCIVNRAWYWLFGRGIIHEPDDIRNGNPPSNPALLAHLQREFVTGGYNMKRLFRLILVSRTYQVSSVIPKTRDPAAAEANFAFYPLRQLEAEVLIDAINGITRTSDLYTSPIPEPFTFIPETKSAVALPDGSITSPFLEQFGRRPCDILINATSVGMVPHAGAMAVDPAALDPATVVMDLVYNPRQTRLLSAARARGCTTVEGLEMFVAQGAAQIGLWTNRPAPVALMRDVVAAALEKGHR